MEIKDYIDTNNAYFKIKVVTNSNKTEFIWIMDNWVLKIRLKSLPEKWKANIELIKFLSGELNINKNAIKIISWHTNHFKIINID